MPAKKIQFHQSSAATASLIFFAAAIFDFICFEFVGVNSPQITFENVMSFVKNNIITRKSNSKFRKRTTFVFELTSTFLSVK